MRLLEGRLFLYLLPTMTVAVMVLALFGPGAERAVRAVRVYGGPTGAAHQSFRLELVDSVKTFEAPVTSGQVTVVLRSPEGHEASWTGSVEPDGTAEVRLPSVPAADRYEMSVTQGERELARGPVQLDERAWLARATRRGGWILDRSVKDVELRMAVGRGALAVPFREQVLIDVRRGELSVQADIAVEVEGGSVPAGRLRKASREPARVELTPHEHAVTVKSRVRAEGDLDVESRIALPVVAGAINAVVEGDRLIVTSPVPRERAYYTLVTDHYRISGGSLKLVSDGRGGASASVRLPELPLTPVWAVVSSAVDLESPARVGWPVAGHVLPAQTLDVPEHLLLDGMPRALRREAARQRRVRLVTVAFCALALIFSLALLAQRARRAETTLEQHFRDSGMNDELAQLAPRRTGWTLAALCAVALGFVVLALFALLSER